MNLVTAVDHTMRPARHALLADRYTTAGCEFWKSQIISPLTSHFARMADHACQFRLDLLFFEFLPSLIARGKKSWKARVLNFGALAEGEMFCRNSSTA